MVRQLRARSAISIHAPTKGATRGSSKSITGLYISIHAPTKGATTRDNIPLSRQTNFNPRSHEGSDAIALDERAGIADFNPRSHEGSDAWIRRLRKAKAISIHAPTKGATPWKQKRPHGRKFQSTLPRRERLFSRFFAAAFANISIHAPTKGATLQPADQPEQLGISIHAPTKGATAFINIFSLAVRLFFISSHQ